jgi:pilus assembly protein CpaB
MDRRLLTVLGVSLLFALVISSIFYQMVSGASKPKGPLKTDTRDVVLAARALAVGVSLKPGDVKTAKVPVDQFPKDGFSRIEEVLDRPVVSSILAEEPVREGRLALRGSGIGLAPVIPSGMRAVSVRVNDVVGVAGFVLPGMRVDVLVTGRPQGSDTARTRTVLQDILVLSAGQKIEPDAGGRAITAPVVTLLVTPEQAETLTLASENRIQLVLRNSSDRSVAQTQGRDQGELLGAPRKAVAAARPSAPAPVVEKPAPPAPPPPRLTEDVVIIRGTERTVEQVRIKNPS